MVSGTTSGAAVAPLGRPRRRNYARRYWMFAVPAAFIVAAVIVFPWLFTVFMSVHDWKVSGNVYFLLLDRPTTCTCSDDDRFPWSVVRTLYFTSAAVVLPVLIGLWAAVCFARKFRLRGAARTAFHPADDGDAGGDRAGVDHDVSSPVGRVTTC